MIQMPLDLTSMKTLQPSRVPFWSPWCPFPHCLLQSCCGGVVLPTRSNWIYHARTTLWQERTSNLQICCAVMWQSGATSRHTWTAPWQATTMEARKKTSYHVKTTTLGRMRNSSTGRKASRLQGLGLHPVIEP